MILTYIQSIEDISKREIVEKIYNIYYHKMFACANKILNNENDTLDAVQNAFYNITKTYDLFTEPHSSACSALVHIYTRNAAINIYNKNKKRNELITFEIDIDDLPDSEVDLQNSLVEEEAFKTVSKAIDTLPTQYKDIILLKYYYKMTSKDISLVLHIKPKAVDKKAHKAKAIINKMLGGEEI